MLLSPTPIFSSSRSLYFRFSQDSSAERYRDARLAPRPRPPPPPPPPSLMEKVESAIFIFQYLGRRCATSEMGRCRTTLSPLSTPSTHPSALFGESDRPTAHLHPDLYLLPNFSIAHAIPRPPPPNPPRGCYLTFLLFRFPISPDSHGR